ncbi:MAG: fibronectin type III domain-containing protein [Bacteroidales bacterium]|nr:fibronectin type III domain-containing protein [Bacteroidales bacterium]
MKKILLLFMTAVLSMPLMLNAQLTATFGTGTSHSSTGGSAGSPMSSGAVYSYTQNIYTAAELTAANVPAGATIIAIEFYNGTGESVVMESCCTYMGHRSTTSFTSATDYTPFNQLTFVDSSNWVSTGLGWFTVNLTNPFIWDGTSNLLVAVTYGGAVVGDTNCGYNYTAQSESRHWRRGCRITDGPVDAEYASHADWPGGTSPSGGAFTTPPAVSANRPNLRITYVLSSCPSLTPTVANIGPYSADLSWINFQQSALNWDLLYGEAGTFDTISGGTSITNVTDTFYYMTGLSAGTMYQLYLKSHCSSETGSWSAPRTFTTLAACPTPINLTLMSHTAEEATISWMPGATESSWEVVCVPHGDPVYSGTPTVVYNSPYTISNLIDNTPYDVYVRAECGNGEYSYWTSAVTFTTDPYCTEPTNVHATQVVGTSALINWNSAPVGATGYTVGYSEAGLDNWTTIPSVTGTSYMLSGLTPNTSYDVFVLTECDQGDADSVFATFTTNCLVGGDLQIGDGTTTSSYIPSYSTYENGYSQQLFTAAELGGASQINSVAFEMTAVSQQRNFKIYLMHTTNTNLSSGWLPASNATLVYDAPHTFVTGWNTFNFSTPFNYDGTSNLLLIVIDENTSWTGGNTWRTHNAFSGSARYTYQDNTPYSITTTPSATGTVLNTRNNVIFGVPCDSMATCVAPNVYVAEFDAHNITVDWAPGNTESSWELEYSTDGTNWISEGTVSTSPYTISNLTENTEYIVRMRSICGGSDYSDYSAVSVRTACADLTTLPFMENFDSYTGATTTSVTNNNLPYCWSYLNEGTSTSYSGYPIIYASATYAASGSNSLRFYTYTTSGTYDDQIAILPPVDTDVNPLNTLQIALDVRDNTTTYPFHLDVGIMTDPTDRNTFVTIQTITTSITTYENYEIPFNQYSGTGKYIALRASQPTSGYNYGYVDNIRVELIPACPRPINVTSSAVTTNSITLGWTEVGSATSWVITYGPTGFTPGTPAAMTETVYENPYTVTGLSASTGYDFYVQSDCGGGEYSNMSNVHTAATQCDVITALPLMENFDNIGSGSTVYPNCWLRYNNYSTTTSYPYVSTSYHNSGNASLYFYSSSSTYNYAVLPPIDANIYPINTLQVSFQMRSTSSATTSSIQVGVMTDSSNVSTFVPVQTVHNSTTGVFEPFEVPLTSYTGTGQFIALKLVNTSSTYSIYMDDLIVDIAPLCDKPTNVIASNVTADGADINWLPGGDETGWEIVVVPAGMSITTGTPEPVSTHPYTLTNLNPNTAYDVYVRADCGTGVDFSSWSQVCHFTTTPLCSAPTDVEVSQVAGSSALLTWTPAIFGATAYTVAYTETGMDSWTSQSVTGDSYMLTGLTPETSYTVTITSECDEGTAPTITKTFMTPCLYGGNMQIGNGTTTTYQLPLNNYYNYSYTQQIFLASELSGPATINDIAFEYSYSSPSTAKSNVSIYLGHTNKSSFSSTSDTVNPANLQLVYTGPMNCQQGWNTFNFTSAFQYNGTDNLVVAIDDNSGDYDNSSYTFYAHNAGATRSMYFYSDTYNMDPTDPASSGASSSTTSSRTNIKISTPCDYTVTCIAPNVYVSDATENSLTVNWAPGNNESSWEVEYNSSTDSTWVSQGTVTNAPYTINGLQPNTLYNIRMRSVCGGGEFSNWVTVSERTACAPIAAVPYMENFDSWTGATTTSVSDNNLPYCWSYFNEGTSTSYSGYPIIYASATYAASGSNSMRFYTYTTAGTYDDQTAILPPVDVTTLPINTLQLTFDARQNSTSYPFVLEVGVMTDPTDINTFMLVSTITCQSTTYTNYEIPLSQYSGPGAYIAIRAPQPSANYNYGYVDNVVLENIPTCPKPTQVHVVSSTSTSVELGWTENGTASNWDIEYGPVGFAIGSGTEVSASTNPFTVSGLNPSTVYDFYVRANCGGGDVSNYAPVFTASTECEPISQLPYTENFDGVSGATTTSVSTNNLPICWRNLNQGTSTSYSGYPIVYNTTSYAASGSNSMRFYTYTTSGTYDDQMAILPEIDVNTFPMNTLQLSFDARNNSTYTFTLVIGVISNPADKTTFVPVDTLITNTGSYGTYEFPLNNYTGNGHYIALMAPRPASSYNSGYVDNIEVGLIPTCPKPHNLHAVDVTINSVELGWTEMGSATSWEIAYGAPGFDPDDASEATVVTASTNPFTVQNLNSSTNYEFYVRSLCSSTDISYWSSNLEVATTMTPVALPYTADFSTNDAWVLNNGSCTNYWVKGTVSGTPALFVTDNGTTPNYSITSTSVVAAQKLFTVGTSDTITITFDVQVQGEGSYDYMKLFLAPASAQFPASTSAPSSGDYGYNSYSTNAYDFYTNGYGSQSSYHYVMNMASGTVHVVAKMPNPNANPTSTSTALMVFAWKNDLSVGTQPPATITNLSVTTDGSGPGPVVTDPTVATNAATAIETTSATLHATITNPDNVTISAKGFEWKTTTSGTFTQIAGTGSGNGFTANLTNLTPNTGYTYKAFITYNGTTVYGNEMTFTTLEQGQEPCNVPTGLTASDVQGESITITWNNDANVSSWNIQYRPEGGQLSTASTQTNSYTITGLTGGTTYQIQVQANCGDGNLSDWSPAINVTTTGIENWLESSVNLYPNPAKEYVDIRVDGDLNVTMMEVYDVYGKLINTVNVIDNPTRINVSSLANGMYFVRVTTEKGMVTKTFVKR